MQPFIKLMEFNISNWYREVFFAVMKQEMFLQQLLYPLYYSLQGY